MDCIICRNFILKGEARASEVVEWQMNGSLVPKGETFRRTLTGRKAHVVCLEGKRYDKDQMTLDDYIEQGG